MTEVGAEAELGRAVGVEMAVMESREMVGRGERWAAVV